MNVCPVLVGRDLELRALVDALDRGGLVLVAGEAGIGKSRLLREFSTKANEQGRVVVWGRAEAVTLPGPYSVVMDLLDDLASLARRRDDHEARDLASVLDRLEGGDEPPARQVSARIRGLLASLGAPPVVLIEDLHYADELSQAVLVHLARSAADDGMLVVASYRPEEAMHGPVARLLDLVTRDRIAMQVELAPLDRQGVAAMLEAMWGSEPEAPDLDALAKLGEGIPFFVEELAAARASGGAAVPASIARAVATRLDRLDERGREVIRAAALMAGAIDPAVLAEVCDVPESDIPGYLIAAVRAGLLTDDESHLVFRHALVRGSLAETIVSVERRALHGKLAAAIERRATDGGEPHAAALARHWDGAGDAARAARYWLAAGRRALAAGALDEATEAFDRAAAGAADDDVRLHARAGIAEVLIRTRAWEHAETALREVADGFDRAGDAHGSARARSRLAWLKQLDGDREAIDLLDAAIDRVGDETDPLSVRLVLEKGYALVRTFHDPDAAAPLLEEGLKRAEELDDAELRALGLEGLGWVAEYRGDLELADRYGEDACAIALASGHVEQIGRTLGNHALRLTIHGRGEDALALMDLARPAGSSLFTHNQQALDHERVWILWRLGRPAEAEKFASRLQATRWAFWYSRLAQVWATVERGATDEAEVLMDAWWASIAGPDGRARALGGDLAVGEGIASIAAIGELVVRTVARPQVDDETVRFARDYLALCAEGAPDTWLLVAAIVARAELRAGNLDAAADLLERCDEVLEHAPLPLQRAAVDELHGMLASARGDHAGAAVWFRGAAERFAGAGNQADRARALRLAAEAAHAAGADRDETVATLRQARETAAGCGALAEANRAEAALRALGVRPRAGRPKGSGTPKGSLSARESEVAALVASGASNAEIAARLFLSERTVQDHITGALRRLGLTSRAGLAAWAAKQGLV